MYVISARKVGHTEGTDSVKGKCPYVVSVKMTNIRCIACVVDILCRNFKSRGTVQYS